MPAAAAPPEEPAHSRPRASATESVRVYCRVRPLSRKESRTPARAAIAVSFPNKTATNGAEFIVCEQPSGELGMDSNPASPLIRHQHPQQKTSGGGPVREELQFAFARVLTPAATQADVYACVAQDLVHGVVHGYNGTVFAYGQTSSGKTHTMFGGQTASRPRRPTRIRTARDSTRGPAHVVEMAGGSEWAEVSYAEGVVTDTDSDDVSSCVGGSGSGVGADVHPSEGLPEGEGVLLRRPFSYPRLTRRTTGGCGEGVSPVEGPPPSLPAGVGQPDTSEGVIPRAVRDIFALIARADAQLTFEVRLLFVEVYMEQVRDLLSPSPPAHAARLRVREDVDSGSFYVEGCASPFVASAEEALQHVEVGLARRATFATRMNEASSRSHCILNITVKSTHAVTKEATTGKLFLVDLAGSEKVSKTGSSGVRLEEAKQINLSLTSLSMVIVALSEGAAHVPYRNSVLTMLLKDSLGGNARTALVTCCSPSRANVAETISTLRFGVRAANIKNTAVVNREMSTATLTRLLAEAKKEISRLRRELRAGAGPAGPDDSTSGPASSRGDPAPLSSRADLHLRIRTLEVSTAALEDALRAAEEVREALTEQREEQRERIAKLEEAALQFDERLVELQRARAEDQRELASARYMVRQQADEIALLISQLEAHLEPIRMARALLEDREQQRLSLLGPGLSSHRRRTLLVLEEATTQGYSAEALGGAELFASEPSPKAQRPPSVRAASSEGDRRGAGTALLGAGSSFGATSTSPLRFGASTACAGERAVESGETADVFDVTESMIAHQTILNAAARELVGERAKGSRASTSVITADRSPTALPATGEADVGPWPLSTSNTTPAAAPSQPSPLSPCRAHGPVLSDAAARRIAELEAELTDTEARLAASTRSCSTLRLEVQHAEKIMSKRQERIESLNLCLQHAASENSELHRILDTDRAAAKRSLKRARDDVAYWQRKYEELSAQRGPREVASMDIAHTGAAIVKTLRGGVGACGEAAPRGAVALPSSRAGNGGSDGSR